MKQIQKKQYTIRNLEPKLDETLRAKSKNLGKSLNDVVLEALRKGAGLTDAPSLYHDLDSLSGCWKKDPEFEKSLQEQDQIDPHLWS